MLGSPILYLKGMRILMFQLSGIYYKLNCSTEPAAPDLECRAAGLESSDIESDYQIHDSQVCTLPTKNHLRFFSRVHEGTKIRVQGLAFEDMGLP